MCLSSSSFLPPPRERGMRAAAVLSPWCRAPSPSRTLVTARTVVRFVSTTPTGPTAASHKTAAASMCLRSPGDDMLTRSALRRPGRAGKELITTNYSEPYTKPRELIVGDRRSRCKYRLCWRCEQSLISWVTGSHPFICPQDSVFQDLGEGILENALQVAIIIYLTRVSFTYITKPSVFRPPSSMFSNNFEVLGLF